MHWRVTVVEIISTACTEVLRTREATSQGIILVVKFNCKDAAAELVKVASLSKANNVVFSGFVVFASSNYSVCYRCLYMVNV